jgi:hypothetical protein
MTIKIPVVYAVEDATPELVATMLRHAVEAAMEMKTDLVNPFTVELVVAPYVRSHEYSSASKI